MDTNRGIIVKCYLCGGTDLKVIRNRLRHDIQRNVLKCGHCELVYLEPQEQDLKTYYASEYRTAYTPVVGQSATSQELFDMYLPYQQERLERILPYLSPDMVALEVGCSAGYFLHSLKPHVKECVGIEFNLENTRFVNQQLGIRAYSDPIEKSDIPHASLDLICAFHVVEHMDDPIRFLETISPYLKPDGLLYVEVPNVNDALISIYDAPSYQDFWYREPHLFNFSPDTLKMTMDKVGFAGQMYTIQRYSFLNHLHWAQTGKPQESADVAMRVPVLASAKDLRGLEAPARELDSWLAEVDRQYRALLTRHGLGDSIVFIGSRVD